MGTTIMTDRIRPDVLDEYYQQNAADKLLRASKENPAMPIGLSLGTGAFAYMMYSMKYSKQKLSVHLIHTLIAVQGSIVGVLTGMLLYQFYQDTMKRSENKKNVLVEKKKKKKKKKK